MGYVGAAQRPGLVTPELRALLADALHLLRVLGPMCAHSPERMHGRHLELRCAEIAERIERHTPPTEAR